MRRRTLVKRGAALASGTALSGCLGQLGFKTQSAWRDPPLVKNRPDAVYYPAIVEEMGLYGTTKVDGVEFGLFHSYPHRFWNITGTNLSKVVVQPSDSVHLMASAWDAETNTVLPIDISLKVSGDDGMITTATQWPMLSPNMGFHYGDNIALPGEGTYDVTLSIGALGTNRTQPFEGRFTEPRTATMSFSFDTSETYNLNLRRLGEKAGTRGTVELMDMKKVPLPLAPPKSELPGRLLGKGTSGDAVFFASVVEENTRFSDNDHPYLVVSPRTPYNRIILPRMALSATVTRGQDTVFEGPLQATLDPELSYYYGAPVGNLKSGDSIMITIDTPPQLARHDGYETAFIEMPPMEFTV